MSSDDDRLPFFHWQKKPTVRRSTPTPGERLWELRRDHVDWACELVFRGESWGWEVRLLRDGELAMSRRFIIRKLAERWAVERRRDIERGWIDEF